MVIQSKSRVLYIEDIVQSFDAVRMWLESLDYEMLPRVASIQEAAKVICTEKPDVVLVDLELHEEKDDLSKVARFVSELRRSQPNLIVLVHSAADKIRSDIVRTFLASGVSYLVKDDIGNPEHLDRAIKHARTGGVVFDKHVVESLGRIASSEAPSLLTKREWEVAGLVAHHLSNKAIADELGIAPARVSELVSNVLRKLEFTRRSQIIIWYLEQPLSGHMDTNLTHQL